MKKILFAALAAFTILGAGTAWAESGPGVARRLVYEQVAFRAQVAANPASVWDSLTTSRVGAAGASSVLDTSVAISTIGWDIPNTAAAGDSALFAQVIVYDATVGGDCESGADSLGLAVQVSADGVTWATASTVAGAAGSGANFITSRNDQTVSGAFYDRISANGAALANGAPMWVYKIKIRGSQGLAVLDNSSPALFPYVRFILAFHDAKGYIVNMKVGHFSGVQ